MPGSGGEALMTGAGGGPSIADSREEPAMAFRIRRVRAIVLAAGFSTLLAVTTAASALADGGVGPFPR